MIKTTMNDYMEQLIHKRNSLLTEMEHFAKENHVPIMELVGIETLLQMLRLQHPTRILEIGTAIGYSAIRMAQALPEATIVTVERDEIRYKQALAYISRAGLSKRITVLFGDAFDVFWQVKELAPFDSLFIDAAKGQYQRFFEQYGTLVKPNGVIYSDNVLFRGLVAEQEIENRRIRSLAKKIDAYNEWLMNHLDFITTIIPVGDGIAISIKRGEENE